MNIRIYNRTRIAALVLASVLGSTMSAYAGTQAFSFSGGTLSGSGVITYSPTGIADTEWITGITGTFTDTAIGLSAAITGLAPVPSFDPTPTFAAPAFTASGLSYDNLFYPDGNCPIVCAMYPVGGGWVDTYGVVFDVANSADATNPYQVDIWSDGNFGGGPQYEAADALGTTILSPYVSMGPATAVVLAAPEPSSFLFLGAGLVGLTAFRKRKPKA